jgi:hypothetical protein
MILSRMTASVVPTVAKNATESENAAITVSYMLIYMSVLWYKEVGKRGEERTRYSL